MVEQTGFRAGWEAGQPCSTGAASYTGLCSKGLDSRPRNRTEKVEESCSYQLHLRHAVVRACITIGKSKCFVIYVSTTHSKELSQQETI